MNDDWEDIEVKRSTDRVIFESNLIQSVYDRIDSLRDESKGILREIDAREIKQQWDEFDLEEFTEDTINQIDDVFDNISQFKDLMVHPEVFPDDVREQYRNTQAYLNRDADYLRRARSKLERLDSEKLTNVYKTNNRVVELCDKAILVRPDNFDAYVIKGQALTNLKRYDDAIDAYITALSFKDDVEVWFKIADANRLNRHFEDAIDVYDSILEKYDNSFEVFKGKARVYFDMKDYAECNKMFKKANEIDYLDKDSFNIWSECLEKLQND